MNKELKIVLALGAIVLLGLMGAAAWYNSAQPPATSAGAGIVPSDLIRPDSPRLGPANAAVTLVEFLDPECEACAAFHPVVKRVLREYEGRLHFVVRYMPFHRSSLMAIAATEAAGLQGRYWEMQELLFTRPGEWSHRPSPNPATFIAFARDLGLDVQQFEKDLMDPQWATKAQRDMADGKLHGVEGTPTFFVNGVKLQELSYDGLRSAIDVASAAARRE